MLTEKSIHEFLAELKSDSPAPGGGSAAALAGAVGAALGAMVGNLTVSSAKYANVHAEMKQLIPSLEGKLKSLEGYIDEDTEAFNQVMAAYKLPKSTDAEKLLRSQVIQQALQEASKLPMKVAQVCMEVLELSYKMLELGNSNAASDAAVAGRMAHAAVWSAVYNVEINVASIKDADFVNQMSEQIRLVVDKSDALLAQLAAKANEKI